MKEDSAVHCTAKADWESFTESMQEVGEDIEYNL